MMQQCRPIGAALLLAIICLVIEMAGSARFYTATCAKEGSI
jgi:hypothetical protein